MKKDAYNKSLIARYLHCPKCAWTSVRTDFDFKFTNIKLIPDNSINFFIVRERNLIESTKIRSRKW